MGCELTYVDANNKRTFFVRDSSFGYDNISLNIGTGFNLPFRKHKDFYIFVSGTLAERSDIFKYVSFSEMEDYSPSEIFRVGLKGYIKCLKERNVKYKNLFDFDTEDDFDFQIAVEDEVYEFNKTKLYETPFITARGSTNTTSELAKTIFVDKILTNNEDPIKTIYETYKILESRNLNVDFPIFVCSTDTSKILRIDEDFNITETEIMEID